MLKQEFDPEQANWFEDKQVWIDLGYQGFDNHYSSRQTHMPLKRPRRKSKKDPLIKLTPQQKAHNKTVSKKRIFVEHAIGGMKRYHILTHSLRCRDARFYSIILGVCAGLWNYILTR